MSEVKKEETRLEAIIRLRAEGLKPKQIATQISTEEDPITFQAVVKLAKEYDLSQVVDEFAEVKPVGVKPEEVKPKEGGAVVPTFKPLEGEVLIKNSKTFTAEEYGDYSVKNGRTRYGNVKGVKVKATIEELRAYINSHWTPSMLMEKWQFTEDELTQLVWKLSRAELRDKPVKVNFKNDFFR